MLTIGLVHSFMVEACLRRSSESLEFDLDVGLDRDESQKQIYCSLVGSDDVFM